ncbi:hypothetical protein DFH11DRAFT_1548432 [Phellopilus nigrolimitatus]|nr:hypothetical protein DFH11DRAFT_1548432 [Phellopilus nigrolimitatus]
MSAFTIISASLLIAIMIRPAAAQTFELVCQGTHGYPDVCDNYSYAVYCAGITGSLHYDATSDAGTGAQRRAAIGCTGAANQCARTGTQCDEYPYASTYDGGLGCYPGGYAGQDHLKQAGTTRCANGPQNGRHGQAIGQFYSNMLHNNNGQAFLVGYQNDVRGPLGELIRTQGTGACPDDSTGIYRYRTTPATDSCPSRGSGNQRRANDVVSNSTNLAHAVELQMHNVTTESGRVVTVPYSKENSDAVTKFLAVGQPIWTHSDDGTGVSETIVTSNVME